MTQWRRRERWATAMLAPQRMPSTLRLEPQGFRFPTIIGPRDSPLVRYSSGRQAAGRHEVRGSPGPNGRAGMYFVRMEAGGKRFARCVPLLQ